MLPLLEFVPLFCCSCGCVWPPSVYLTRTMWTGWRLDSGSAVPTDSMDSHGWVLSISRKIHSLLKSQLVPLYLIVYVSDKENCGLLLIFLFHAYTKQFSKGERVLYEAESSFILVWFKCDLIVYCNNDSTYLNCNHILDFMLALKLCICRLNFKVG